MKSVEGRIRSFDLLRGYLIFVIFVNHLALSPSLFQFVTGRNLFWVSAAEGFFFLSGAMVGLVRKNDDGKTARKKLLRRAWILYLVTIVITLSLTAVAILLPAAAQQLIKSGFATTISAGTLLKTLTLQYSYGYADFWPYYVIFLLASIPLLYALRNKLWWFVLAIGIICWFEPRIVDWGQYSYHFYWGSYFIFGLVFGYYYREISMKVTSLPTRVRRQAGSVIITIGAAMLAANYFFMYSPKVAAKLAGKAPEAAKGLLATTGGWVGSIDNYLQPLLMSNRSGVLRLLAFAVIGASALVLFTRYEELIARRFGGLLLPFGQQSLRTYILQAYVIFLASIFILKSNFVSNTIMAGALVYILWFMIDRGWFKRIIPN